jgi:hypothetical protein
MPTFPSLERYVSVDVGCYRHRVAVGLSNGVFLESFAILYPGGQDFVNFSLALKL